MYEICLSLRAQTIARMSEKIHTAFALWSIGTYPVCALLRAIHSHSGRHYTEKEKMCKPSTGSSYDSDVFVPIRGADSKRKAQPP